MIIKLFCFCSWERFKVAVPSFKSLLKPPISNFSNRLFVRSRIFFSFLLHFSSISCFHLEIWTLLCAVVLIYYAIIISHVNIGYSFLIFVLLIFLELSQCWCFLFVYLDSVFLSVELPVVAVATDSALSFSAIFSVINKIA